jgi:hypothetical protein
MVAKVHLSCSTALHNCTTEATHKTQPYKPTHRFEPADRLMLQRPTQEVQSAVASVCDQITQQATMSRVIWRYSAQKVGDQRVTLPPRVTSANPKTQDTPSSSIGNISQPNPGLATLNPVTCHFAMNPGSMVVNPTTKENPHAGGLTAEACVSNNACATVPPAHG